MLNLSPKEPPCIFFLLHSTCLTSPTWLRSMPLIANAKRFLPSILRKVKMSVLPSWTTSKMFLVMCILMTSAFLLTTGIHMSKLPLITSLSLAESRRFTKKFMLLKALRPPSLRWVPQQLMPLLPWIISLTTPMFMKISLLWVFIYSCMPVRWMPRMVPRPLNHGFAKWTSKERRTSGNNLDRSTIWMSPLPMVPLKLVDTSASTAILAI
mmetsp:Transcript_119459/g.166657  ORF Transcript_119459/g.166657 Transcript_119459/m.166657 type:complete len:210 (+) Transcript_119459:125-754(+)